MNIQWIEKLQDLPKKPYDYVADLVSQRIEDLRKIPSDPRNILEECDDKIVDIGPGEGVSSMALAQIAENSQVFGIEMDRKHLVAAWPFCKKYKNLELAWGAISGTPSNSQIDEGLIAVPQINLPDNFCEVLFTWCGMSRKDIFEPSTYWSRIVKKACILVLPKFWREGFNSLPQNAKHEINNLCDSLEIKKPFWKAKNRIPGFSQPKPFAFDKKIEARGWLLWLTGIFDSQGITLWDTLRDRWEKQPKYQLPDYLFELEILLCFKG
jgi:hypothetical protein